jgi:AAA domain-containing protein
MSFQEFTRLLNDLEHGAKAIQKAHKLELLRLEREERTATLRQAAKDLKARGASQATMRRILDSLNDYLTILHKPATPDPTNPTDPPPVPNAHPQDLLLSDIDPRPLTWLWPQRIPLGKLTLLEGDPGIGTSLFATHLAACLTTGHPLPDGTPAPHGSVIWIAPHDSPHDTLKPRFLAAGGDPSRVLLLNSAESLDPTNAELYERPFSLAHDLPLLEAAITRTHAALVIIDPLSAVLDHPTHPSRSQRSRDLFTPLAHLAERTNCAILLIRQRPSGRSGSLKPIPSARSRLIITSDPAKQEQRLFANISHPFSPAPSTLTFQIVGTDQGIPHLLWLAATQRPVQALLAPISYERRIILKALADSPKPLYSAQVASITELKIGNVRKMLSRLLDDREIASPARGSYTSLTHTPLPTIPFTTPVANVANVPNDQPTCEETVTTSHDESPHQEKPTVANVASIPNDQPTQDDTATIPHDESSHEETTIPPEIPVANVANNPSSQEELLSSPEPTDRA